MPQDPTGSGSSSSSSSSDLAESDDRNDEDDDKKHNGNGVIPINATSIIDQVTRHEEDAYDDITSDGRPLNFFGAPDRKSVYDSRTLSGITDCVQNRRRYDDFSEREYIETALSTEPANGVQDYSSSSANSLDNLCHGQHQRMLIDFNHAGPANAHDHYMIPTHDPRDLNERIMSLFNPQFLPNFNDMFMYVANQCDSRRSPPPRSRSMADGESRLFTNSSYRRKRAGTNSMFFRRGLTYEPPEK